MDIEQVLKYRVSPRWGHKNLKVLTVRCLKKGKTVYVPLGHVSAWGKKDLYDTPREAIEPRLEIAKEEEEPTPKWAAECRAEIEGLENLLKQYVG